jgi:hypothetical protein
VIVLSAGMPRSGSGWYFNLTNDLLVAAGYQDAHIMRDKFRLHSTLRGDNCRVDHPILFNLGLAAIPHFLGNTFVVKTHCWPSRGVRFYVSLGIVKATYIYRDPRDVVISGFEQGQRARRLDKAETPAFANWDSIKASVLLLKRSLAKWDSWVQYDQALIVRYEDLVTEPYSELQRLADFLSLDVSSEDVHKIVENYQREGSQVDRVPGLHFNKGVIGRFREVMGPKELDFCREHLGDYLKKMGYPE